MTSSHIKADTLWQHPWGKPYRILHQELVQLSSHLQNTLIFLPTSAHPLPHSIHCTHQHASTRTFTEDTVTYLSTNICHLQWQPGCAIQYKVFCYSGEVRWSAGIWIPAAQQDHNIGLWIKQISRTGLGGIVAPRQQHYLQTSTTLTPLQCWCFPLRYSFNFWSDMCMKVPLGNWSNLFLTFLCYFFLVQIGLFSYLILVYKDLSFYSSTWREKALQKGLELLQLPLFLLSPCPRKDSAGPLARKKGDTQTVQVWVQVRFEYLHLLLTKSSRICTHSMRMLENPFWPSPKMLVLLYSIANTIAKK